ncbi:MAG: hypothetical protein KGJ43_00805, partial [Acidobacteriota bacterium]|nr:hypothetical protein [Acidobacteriota bacterium]
MLLRFLIWRLAELLACAFAIAVGSWWLEGGPRMLLTGQRNLPSSVWAALAREPTRVAGALAPALPLALALGALAAAGTLALLLSRWRARARRRYVRLRVVPYRTDQATPEAVVAMFESLHKCRLQRWWERLARGQASLAVEVHRARGGSGEVGLAICCP